MTKIAYNETGDEFKYGNLMQLFTETKIGTRDMDIQTHAVSKEGNDTSLEDTRNYTIPFDISTSHFWLDLSHVCFSENLDAIKNPENIKVYTEGNLGITYSEEDIINLLSWFNTTMNSNFTIESLPSEEYVYALDDSKFTAGMILRISDFNLCDEHHFYEVDYDWKMEYNNKR